jgi:hypothetical protein
MQLTLDDENTKALLTEILVDLLCNEKALFKEILLEALEEVSFANAIIEGRQDDFVEETAIFSILEGTTQNNASQI